jgi:hypothetical protein
MGRIEDRIALLNGSAALELRHSSMDNRGRGTQGKEAETEEVDQWILEGRANGVILVRIPSRPGPDRLPDAVFTFRPGDPQYRRWQQRLGA